MLSALHDILLTFLDWVGSEEDYDSEPMGSITELGNPPHDDLNDVDV
jgi:hypothetical protein